MNLIRHGRADPFVAPHLTSAECDRWYGGCQHISDAQAAAIEASEHWRRWHPEATA